MNQTFKIKNKLVEGLVRWLWSLSLGVQSNKVRVQFIELINPRVAEIDAKRVENILRYAKRDKENNPTTILMVNGERNYDVPQEKMGELNANFAKVLEEEFEVQVTDENKNVFKGVRDLLLDEKLSFGVNDNDPKDIKASKVSLALAHNEWCKAFEILSL